MAVGCNWRAVVTLFESNDLARLHFDPTAPYR
jgi:hypothetical protein